MKNLLKTLAMTFLNVLLSVGNFRQKIRASSRDDPYTAKLKYHYRSAFMSLLFGIGAGLLGIVLDRLLSVAASGISASGGSAPGQLMALFLLGAVLVSGLVMAYHVYQAWRLESDL